MVTNGPVKGGLSELIFMVSWLVCVNSGAGMDGTWPE